MEYEQMTAFPREISWMWNFGPQSRGVCSHSEISRMVDQGSLCMSGEDVLCHPYLFQTKVTNTTSLLDRVDY